MFRAEFDTPSFKVPGDLFVPNSKSQTQSKVKCLNILDVFSQNWNGATHKEQYIQAFTLSNWKSLSSEQQLLHTLSYCTACYTESGPLQQSFPLKPVYVPESTITITITRGPEKFTARKVLKVVNREWVREYGHTQKLFPRFTLRPI